MDSAFPNSGNTTDQIKRGTAPKVLSSSLNVCETLEQCIIRKLKGSGYKEMDTIGVFCEGDVVTLRGNLPSFFLKQLAQEITKSVPDVDNVCNECVVATASCD